MDLEQLLEDFESTSWEWESGRGLYLVDRMGLGFEARFKRTRQDAGCIELATRNPTGPLEWPTQKSAMRACVLHFVLLETMPPQRAADYIASCTADYFSRARGTLPGVAPALPTPHGAWL